MRRCLAPGRGGGRNGMRLCSQRCHLPGARSFVMSVVPRRRWLHDSRRVSGFGRGDRVGCSPHPAPLMSRSEPTDTTQSAEVGGGGAEDGGMQTVWDQVSMPPRRALAHRGAHAV
eukprot:366561-Chlamydomonas_euryale.AAC.3